MARISKIIELFIFIFLLALLIYFDPAGITRRISEFLRLKYPASVRDPKLLIYASAYIGGLAAKSGLLAVIAAVSMIQKRDLADIFALRMPSSHKWLKGIAPFLILCIAIRLFYSRNPLVQNLAVNSVFPETVIAGNIIIALSALLLSPIVEELIFRGYIFDVIQKSFGAGFAVVAASAAFTLAHAPQPNFGILDLAVMFGFGIIFGVARYKTGSVLAPVIFHSLYNSVYAAVGLAGFHILGY